MTAEVATRLLAIMMTIALGAWLMRWPIFRSREGAPGDPAFVLAQLATYVLVPALLLRTTARAGPSSTARASISTAVEMASSASSLPSR